MAATAPVKVLVTGVGGQSVGHQVLHALSLKPEAYDLTVADANPFSFGLYASPRRSLLPWASADDYLAAVLRLVARDGIQVVIPGTEPELYRLAQHHAELNAAGCILLANPTEVAAICRHKGRLDAWLGGHGFKTPLTATAANWRELAAKAGFPLVGKPASDTGGSRDVKLLVSGEEVERYISDMGGADVLLQEYVADGESEYTVGVMVSRDGAVIDSIVLHRKLVGLSLGAKRRHGDRLYTLSTGYSQGFIVRHPVIQSRCEELALAIGARGPMNIQLRFVDGDISVFEVHPRFSGTTSIRASAGFNEPDVLIRNFLFGEKIGRLDYQHNVAAIRAFQHTLVPMDEMNVDKA